MKIEDFRGPYRWLSNFHYIKIAYNGLTYPTTEHAYQAAKCSKLEDRILVCQQSTPAKAMRLGRKLADRSDWPDCKLQVMEDVLRIKFADPHLKQALAITYPAELVEGNTWNDVYWGVCNGVGQNNLGKLLMKIREEIQS